jgi:hypothetical protein
VLPRQTKELVMRTRKKDPLLSLVHPRVKLVNDEEPPTDYAFLRS